MKGVLSHPVSVIQSCWDLIDGVVCVNRDADTRQWENYRLRAKGVIPEEKLHRLGAVEGIHLPGYGEKPWFTERTGEREVHWAHGGGCLMSHRNAIRLAQEKGWRNVLIMEDDAVPEIEEESLQALARALSDMKGRWVLYLGYSERPRPCGRELWRQGKYSLWQISGALTTHAYIVPQSMYGEILAKLPRQDTQVWSWMARHRAIDNWYRNEVSEWHGVRIFTLLPHLYYQEHFYGRIAKGYPMEALGQSIQLAHRTLYPCTCWGSFRLGHFLFAPFRKLVVTINSLRTYFLCRCVGFRGHKREKRAKMR